MRYSKNQNNERRTMATVESPQIACQMRETITTELSNPITADTTHEKIENLRQPRRTIWNEIEEMQRNIDSGELKRLKMMKDVTKALQRAQEMPMSSVILRQRSRRQGHGIGSAGC
jgi:hypothetical protein